MFKKLKWFLLSMLAASVVMAQVLAICPKCGKEAQSADAAFCMKCGAPYKKRAEEPAAAKPIEAVVAPAQPRQLEGLQAQMLEAIKVDVLAAQALQKSEEAAAVPRYIADATAALYYQNAAALLRLLPADGLSKEGVQIIEAGVQKKPTARSLNLNELKRLALQAHQKYDAAQRLNGRIACGFAWVPSEWALNIEQQALLRTAIPPQCTACAGFGTELCSKCKGLGTVKCTQAGCKDGIITPKQKADIFEVRRIAEEATSDRPYKCPTCKGTGQMGCVDCRATGVISCKRCSGSGKTQRCAQCVGEGLVICTKCYGQGEAQGKTCVMCKGEKRIFCTACKGCGYLSR